ncbi:MAG: AraC family transcriptional regulator [Lachnospiraceae bacterium]|nr:AraC family transcriptional regulator [Lachnospiraceae bacterium]
MDNELNLEYQNIDYPVAVRLIEIRKRDCRPDFEGVRPRDMEIIVVENGSLTVEILGETIKVEKGQGFMIRLGTYRRISWEDENTAFYTLVFRPEFIMVQRSCSPMTKNYYTDLLSSPKQAYLLMADKTLRDEKSLNRVKVIIEANMSKKPGFELITKGNLALLWVSMLERYLEPKAKYTGENVPSRQVLRVLEVKSYLDENYPENLSLTDIAGKIHVSPNECCREFKRVIHLTPVDYLIRRRIFEAAKIIQKDPLSVDSVSELALNVGFNTISYFNRMFKRYMGFTPTDYAAGLKAGDDAVSESYRAMETALDDIKP